MASLNDFHPNARRIYSELMFSLQEVATNALAGLGPDMQISNLFQIKVVLVRENEDYQYRSETSRTVVHNLHYGVFKKKV